MWAGPTSGTRVDRARDNGILIHSTGEDGAYSDTWMYSIEVQIIEGGTGDFLVVGDKSENFAITSPVAAEKQGSSYIYDPDGEMVTIHRSEEHTSELQSRENLVCRLLLEKKKIQN